MPVVLGFRFIYGLRTVAPFAIGLTNISFLKFLILNIISAAIWATVIGILGYYSGMGIEIIFDDVKKYELGILTAALIILIIRLFLNRMKRKRALDAGTEISKTDSNRIDI